MVSSTHAKHIQIRDALRRELAKKGDFTEADLRKFTENMIASDDDIVVGTVGRVYQALVVTEEIDAELPSPWAVMKQVGATEHGTPAYSGLTVKELKALAKKREVSPLPTRKGDLIKALLS